jgi:hypothetical protein
MKRNHLESTMQQTAVRWFKYQHSGLLLFAIPNGGARSSVEASIMKGEGTLAGVADLFLSVPNGQYHGFYIEMKTDKGEQSEAQKEFQKKVETFGYKYAICRTVNEFIELVNVYVTSISIDRSRQKPISIKIDDAQ